MATKIITCARCKQPINTTEGYLVAGDELQFTTLAEPMLKPYEEALHFVCPSVEE